MIPHLLTSFLKAMRRAVRPGRRAQSGQALVVLAIGFVALLGFVGIVTDVSLLFIRYSTMRRAVDAASVAAAGQMRRIIDETPLDGIAQGEAESVANLNLAARQFIELYGLNPTNVLVETCRAQNVVRDPTTLDPQDRVGTNLFNVNGTVNTGANQDDVKRYQELCTEDELKLVRVTAQIEAPTIFMRLLGYDSVTLTESAISQTAVIDVVLIFDVSESMLNETTYSDWDLTTPKQGVRYLPPYFDDAFDDPIDYINPGLEDYDTANNLLLHNQTEINRAIDYDTPFPSAADIDLRYQLTDSIIKFEPNGAGGWQEYTGVGASPVGRVQPRELCRVFASPKSTSGANVPAWLRTEYAQYFAEPLVPGSYANQWDVTQTTNLDNETFLDSPLNPSDPDETGTNGRSFRGFVPQYNYYGCCNDPDGLTDAAGNFDFSDLVCQPFKDARNAAEQFLARLDFIRGDRVAFVTFDRRATVMDPIVRNATNDDIQTAMFESERSFPSLGTLLRYGALDYLRKAIGVRTETTTYADTPDGAGRRDGFWDTIVEGSGADAFDTYSELMTTRIGDFINTPISGACPFDKATLSKPWRLANTYPDGSFRSGALLEDIHSVPSWYSGGAALQAIAYESIASCAGTNIGGALAAGSSTLYNYARQDGAVWIMVLLSDGAAGASNIVRRVNTDPFEPAPYNLMPVTGYHNPLNAMGGTTPLSSYPPDPRAYGAFGLCPYGTAATPGELLNIDVKPPFCQDLLPETRTLCGTVAQSPLLLTLDSFPNCYEFYDVDDYARDWADWVSLADLPGALTVSGTGRVTNQLLPTIFTIGFGLNFNQGTSIVCGDT
ncbi:MAG: pilus assembly protein TadG-related protein, partial [Chloroflexota bacterium]|nr:pilus assembly protein TadG-related protein [Chloroflexota bacterium]